MPSVVRVPAFWLQLAAFALILGALPLASGSYLIHVYTIGLYYVILAVSWNLLAGFTGQFSLATHAFASIGGYGSALLAQRSGLPPLATVPAVVVLAAATGWLLCIATLRMRKIYLALATWAFAESYRLFLSTEYQLTRGDMGLATAQFFPTADPTPYFFLFLAAAVLSIAGVRGVLSSRAGFLLRAIRDDEEAAQAMGVPAVRWKLFAFTVSSLVAGLGGALYGHYVGLLTPGTVKFNEMALIIIMVCAGGMRSFWGPVFGALLIQVLSEALRINAGAFGRVSTLLRDLVENRMVLFAVLVILLMRFSREGIDGLVKSAWAKMRGRV
jgi:branched-chain amino acid transport system permease protein